MTTYAITIHIEITDPEALCKAARDEAIDAGLSYADYEKSRQRDGDPMGVDLRMLLDPGVSPDGCKIFDCTAEKQS